MVTAVLPSDACPDVGPRTGDPLALDLPRHPGTRAARSRLPSSVRRLEPYGRLRPVAAARPPVDPAFVCGLRAWLEDVAAEALARPCAATRAPGAPFVVRAGHDGLVAQSGDGPTACVPDTSTLRRALATVSFRQLLVRGPGDRPYADALDGLRAEGLAGRRLAEAVDRLSRGERTRLARLVRDDAGAMAAQWTPPPPRWLPRVGSFLSAPLAGGAVVLRSTADLVLGAPPGPLATVCVVALECAGSDRGARARRMLLAVLEALRSGAAPLRVATYEPSRGRLVVDHVDEDLLGAAVRAVADCLTSPREAVG